MLEEGEERRGAEDLLRTEGQHLSTPGREEVSKRLRQLNQEVEQLSMDLYTKEQQLADKNAAVSKSERLIAQQETRLRELTQQLTTVQLELRSASEEVSQLKGQRRESESRIAELEKLSRGKSHELQQMELEQQTSHSRWQKTQDTLTQLRESEHRVSAQASELQEEIEALRAVRAHLESQLLACQRERDELLQLNSAATFQHSLTSSHFDGDGRSKTFSPSSTHSSSSSSSSSSARDELGNLGYAFFTPIRERRRRNKNNERKEKGKRKRIFDTLHMWINVPNPSNARRDPRVSKRVFRTGTRSQGSSRIHRHIP
jgi:chromosome segregation ATPase